MKAVTAVALLVLLTTPSLASALAGDKAAYAGGTIARFNVPGKRIEGRVEIGPRQIVFVPDISLHSGAEPLLIDYESIHHLEFVHPFRSHEAVERHADAEEHFLHGGVRTAGDVSVGGQGIELG